MGIISSVASLFGYDPLADAEKKARKELQAGQKDALGYFSPWDSVTPNAVTATTNALGLGNSQAAIDAFKASPEYRLNFDAMLKAGQDAVNNGSYAAGTHNSGRTLMALQDNAGKVTNALFSNYLRGVTGQNDQGLNIAGNKATIRTGGANALADSRRNTGAIKAGNLAGWDQLANTAFQVAGSFI